MWAWYGEIPSRFSKCPATAPLSWLSNRRMGCQLRARCRSWTRVTDTRTTAIKIWPKSNQVVALSTIITVVWPRWRVSTSRWSRSALMKSSIIAKASKSNSSSEWISKVRRDQATSPLKTMCPLYSSIIQMPRRSDRAVCIQCYRQARKWHRSSRSKKKF